MTLKMTVMRKLLELKEYNYRFEPIWTFFKWTSSRNRRFMNMKVHSSNVLVFRTDPHILKYASRECYRICQKKESILINYVENHRMFLFCINLLIWHFNNGNLLALNLNKYTYQLSYSHTLQKQYFVQFQPTKFLELNLYSFHDLIWPIFLSESLAPDHSLMSSPCLPI